MVHALRLQPDARIPEVSGRSGLNAALKRLLDDAGSALDRDPDAARSFIRQASALLRAERDEFIAPSLAEACGGLSPWQMNRGIRHIDAELGATIRIADLASVAHLSASYFARAFKCSFGESPGGYIARHRLERAQQAMLTTDEPLSHIALACGFADQSHMTKLFGRVIGRSPGAWRRNRRRCPGESERSADRPSAAGARELWHRAAA
jgi:AraC family transcriptional regulator